MMTTPTAPTGRLKQVYDALARAADAGAKCPSNDALAELLGIGSIGAASEYVSQLEQRGLIRVERTRCTRRVTITATGRSTAPIAQGASFTSGDQPSGEALVEMIAARAAELGKTPAEFARPLTTKDSVASWLAQLSLAVRPKRITVARVEALIAGRDIPPLPAETMRVRSCARVTVTSSGESPALDESRRVDRDPCPRCGTRRDIGCRHTVQALRVGFAGANARL